MSQPGLLFSSKNPWLASKEEADGSVCSNSYMMSALRVIVATISYRHLIDYDMSFIQPNMTQEKAD